MKLINIVPMVIVAVISFGCGPDNISKYKERQREEQQALIKAKEDAKEQIRKNAELNIAIRDAEIKRKKYIDYINHYGYEWDCDSIEVLRKQFILSKRGMTLEQYDMLLTAIDNARNQALGYKPVIKRKTDRKEFTYESEIPDQLPLTLEEMKMGESYSLMWEVYSKNN